MWVYLKTINIFSFVRLNSHKLPACNFIGFVPAADWLLWLPQLRRTSSNTKLRVTGVFDQAFITCEADWGSLDFKGDKVSVPLLLHRILPAAVASKTSAATQRDLSRTDNSEVGAGWELWVKSTKPLAPYLSIFQYPVSKILLGLCFFFGIN